MGRILIISVILLMVGSFNIATSQTTESIKITTDSIDNRPLLKRWFKDFPTVYTDTAYTKPNFVFVFKATLMNHTWGEHPGKKIKRRKIYAIPDSELIGHRTDSPVKFCKPL